MDSGRAAGIEVEALDPGRASSAERLQRLLGKGRFRPRLEAGEPVITERVVRDYRVR